MSSEIANAMLDAIAAMVRRAETILSLNEVSRQDAAQCRMDLLMPQVHERLLAAGWQPEHVSGGSSFYYSKGDRRLRVSDHEVPLTAEREYNAGNGGFTWSSKGEQILLQPWVGENNLWSEIEYLDEDER